MSNYGPHNDQLHSILKFSASLMKSLAIYLKGSSKPYQEGSSIYLTSHGHGACPDFTLKEKLLDETTRST